VQAPPMVSGYLGLYGGASWAKLGLEFCESGFGCFNFSAKDTLFVYGGHGRVNIWTSPNAILQLDAEVEGTSGFKPESDFNYGGRLSGVIGGHYSFVDPNRYSAGVLAGVIGNSNFEGGSSTLGLIGLEGQSYLGNSTLYGQAGYAHEFSGPSFGPFSVGPDNLWFVRGVARHYWTPNDKLEAEIGYARLRYDTISDGIFSNRRKGDILNWGASYEHMVSGRPWSWYIEYAGYRHTTKNSVDPFFTATTRMTEHIAMVGIRLHLNQPSLQSQERTGARYDMPKFIRALPWTFGGGVN
jgi:hypothetical protein